MNDVWEPPIIYREFICGDGDKEAPRFDFYGEDGNIASTYELHMTAVITAELLSLGYVVKDFPSIKKSNGE
jgi:hypothetical protein